MGLAEDIKAFVPGNDQEAADKRFILERLAQDPKAFYRQAPAHFACSAWTVDPAHQQTLMVYHNIYNSWSWIGGHADGQQDLEAVALRELEEETGVQGRLIKRALGSAYPCLGGIFSLEVLTVDGHVKRDAYVSSHLHLNITYLVEADPAADLRMKPDENSGVCWVPLDQVEAVSTEPWIRERIYRKLVERTRAL